MPCTDDEAGRGIGPGACRVTEIRRRSGASVFFDHVTSGGPSGKSRLLQIKGRPWVRLYHNAVLIGYAVGGLVMGYDVLVSIGGPVRI